MSFEAYRRKRANAADIDLTPVMNLFVVLIPFLLLSAAFFHVGVIPTSLPTQQQGSSDVSQQLDTVTIQVEVTPDALHVSATNPGLSEKVLEELGAKFVRSEDGAFAEDDMSALLTAIKRRYPASDTVIVLPAPGVVYRDVVRVLDVAREYEREDGEKVPLFPVVVMSRKVRG